MRALTDFIIYANPILIYLIVAIVLLFESSGVPIANNTLLLLTGALAAQGYLNIWILIPITILGSITGACLAYIIGARSDLRTFLRLTAILRIDQQKVFMTERWFQKAGLWMIFFSRMTPYVRPFACFLGGLTHMSFRRFYLAALGGSIIWCIVILQVGMALGARWHQAMFLMQRYTLHSLFVLLLGIILYFCIVRVVKRYIYHQYVQKEVSPQEYKSEQTERELLEV